MADTDGDGLTDGDELNTYGTNPGVADTDGDGLTDGDEVNVHGTDPLDKDTDGDLLWDSDEVFNHGTDPLVADTDGDGLSDGAEVNTHGTDPLVADSDGDGISDGDEVNVWGTDSNFKPVFTDATGNTHQTSIELIAAAGITVGCNPPLNDEFCPDGNVSRGQMAAFLNRALHLPGTATDFFGDDNTSIFEDDINRLAAAGITRGCNPPLNDAFCPTGSVTRGEMAAFMVRGFNLPATAVDYFDDDNGSIFEDDINRLAAAGITQGCNPPANTDYCPSALVTRGQMATFLANAIDF